MARSVFEPLESTRKAPVIEGFLRLFKERGLPKVIRSDNGLPFASPNGFHDLSKLSVLGLQKAACSASTTMSTSGRVIR